MDWITDPKVIDVIVALKGLRNGDEIIWRKTTPDHHKEFNSGQIYILSEMNDPYNNEMFGNPTWWMDEDRDVVVGVTTGHYFGRNNIKAWRRP